MTETDGDLLRLCRAGDQEAWRALVERHARRVFGVAYRFAGRADEAEDLTQEVFVKVYQNLDRFREADGSLSAWIAAIARNHAIDHYRRRREERARDVGDPDALNRVPDAAEGAVAGLEREERARFVRDGLRRLPRELREALVLCDLEGLPYQEAARMLGVPLGTVKSRVNRGRLELARRLLGRRGDFA